MSSTSTFGSRPAPTGRIPSPSPVLQERLGAALAEPDTILVLVFGEGPESDAAEARCRALAADPCFDDVRVVRVEDKWQLTRGQRARWQAGRGRLAVVGADRERAVPLDRPDAVELFVAMSLVAAAA